MSTTETPHVQCSIAFTLIRSSSQNSASAFWLNTFKNYNGCGSWRRTFRRNGFGKRGAGRERSVAFALLGKRHLNGTAALPAPNFGYAAPDNPHRTYRAIELRQQFG
jgi:hypothetical protein